MRRRVLSGFLLAMAIAARSLLGDDNPDAEQIADFTLPDSLGASHSLDEWKDRKLVVVAFLGTECPLAKLYGPRLAELAAKYAEQGVQLVGINSNDQDTLREIAH
jgi:thiol-disulfide isomerase/thioredoxin